MTSKKEITILENNEKTTIYLKDGFTKKASILKEIREALQRSSGKKINVYLAPQSEDVRCAITDIRHQLIALEPPKASISSRSCNLFNQTCMHNKRKAHAITYKITSENGVCSIKLDSYKHPIAAYDDTAKEIALILAQDMPQTIQILFIPAHGEKTDAFNNRIHSFERFLKQQALEIPQIQKIYLWKKEKSNVSLAGEIDRTKSGQLFNSPVCQPAEKQSKEQPLANTKIVSKYRLKQLRKEQELQNG